MKKVFQLMGIALIASSMLIACGGNEEEKEDLTPSASVTFAGATSGMDVMKSVIASTGTSQGQNYTLFAAHPVAMNQATQLTDLIPGFETMLLGQEAKEYTPGELDQYGNPTGDIVYMEYWNETALQDQNNNLYGDWWVKSGSVNVSKLDLTAKLISFNVTATMFDAYAALVEQAGVANAATAELSATIKNITLN